MHPIGYVHTDAQSVPRHWSVSDVEGNLVIDEPYQEGLQDIRPGEQIVVIFCFDRSRAFTPDLLRQKPPHRDREFGVFSICSPRRPNPIGLSIVTVLAVDGRTIRVKGIDMLDRTPILDIKPHITGAEHPHTEGTS